MSRSKWAWTEGCALVRAVVRGAGERVARASLLGAVSSTKRLVRLMAASVLVIGVAPAPALAGSVSGSHAKTRTPNNQYSAHVDRASAVVLALGSGYSSRGGAARVRALQRRLAGLGFAPGPVDGRYGPRTEQAVDRVQAVRGLRVDGIAGPQTLAVLTAPIAVLYPGAGSEPAGSGSVLVLQRRLAEAGFAPGPIDGRYGPLTIEAVERFQRADGLTVDGIAGAHTLLALRAARHGAAVTGHPRLPAVPQSPSVPHVPRPGSAPASRAPALPVTPVLLGFAVLGLATMSGSYARTRARVRRARAAARAPQARAPQALPTLTTGLSSVSAAGANHEGSER